MFSEKLISAISAHRDALVDYSSVQTMIASLAFTQQAMMASEGLLVDAIALSEGPLRDYFTAHLEEERGHASWLADDLMSAGIDMKTLPLIRRAVEMAGSQYYLIKHASPASLLGYMAVLEGFTSTLEDVERMEAVHGKTLLRTLRYHVENDPEHCKDLFAVIDQHPCEEIMQSAMLTVRYINELAQDLRNGALWAFIRDNK